jgi:hypothetical protein
MATDEWLPLSNAAELIKDRLGCTLGHAEAILQEARSSGEVRAIQGMDPIYIGTDEGLIDFNARPGAFNGGSAYGSRCPATARGAEISKDDLADWLDRHPPEKAAAKKKHSLTKEDRAKRAAKAIWQTAGPPDHLDNKVICMEVNDWFAAKGERQDMDNATILRAVGRKPRNIKDRQDI